MIIPYEENVTVMLEMYSRLLIVNNLNTIVRMEIKSTVSVLESRPLDSAAKLH